MKPALIAKTAFWLLLLLQPVWHGWLQPPTELPLPFVLGIAVLPLLPAAVALLLRAGTALFWTGVLSLPYFIHAIDRLWMAPEARPYAIVELVLSVAVALAVAYDGLLRRRAARKAA
jgi:uncharacterized membrane protein